MPRPFQQPRPSFPLMWILGWINRWSLLLGLPLFRRVPFLRDLPGVRGHFRLCSLDLPRADRDRLRGCVNAGTVAFLGPNHPEFGFDWMMDKEISTVCAPRMASWASHQIVASAPGFWLRNNLVSHNGGEAAVDFSVRWALGGNGVLLHPEGSVHWTGDLIHPLFNGIADMATEAARRVGAAAGAQPVYIVPIVWKLRYRHDVSGSLHREMHRIEDHLGLRSELERTVGDRFAELQEGILRSRMLAEEFDGSAAASLDFFARQQAFQHFLMQQLESRHVIDSVGAIERRITRLERVINAELRALTDVDSPAAGERVTLLRRDLDRAREAWRLGGFTRESYGAPRLTQEHIAESLKRIRAELVTGGLRNTVHNFLPTPFGPRVAHVRVPEPIRIDPSRAGASESDRRVYVTELVDLARGRMQAAIDGINRESGAESDRHSHPNPFAP